MIEQLVHVGYALMLCALLARDILWLRAILVLAQGNLCWYAYARGILPIAGWNAVFVLINLVWVARILYERRAVQLPERLASIHRRHFSALTAPEFLRLWNWGEDCSLRNARVVRQGETPGALYFVQAGELRVLKDNREITRLGAGRFAAEMNLITGEPASADVFAAEEVLLRSWPMQRLRELRGLNPPLWSKLQSVLGYDLVEKIRASTATARAA